MSFSQIKPYGDTLVDLLSDKESYPRLKIESNDYSSWTLTDRQICDLELLLNGAFSPLKGFMTKTDYDSVLETMRLSDGTLWPLPITLDISEAVAESISIGQKLTLRDKEGFPLAMLSIEEIWKPDILNECEKVFNTNDELHPAVYHLIQVSNPVYVGGTLEGIALPNHFDYKSLRHTPRELREEFIKLKWTNVIAFQTRNPLHKAHVELTKRAAQEVDGNVLIHPVVGLTKPGDVDYYTRVRCYQKVLPHYPNGIAMLSLLPLAMRMGGPREAVLHAIIRRNYGCNFFIVGRDHAGPGKDSNGNQFYGLYDAQDLVKKYQNELEIQLIPFKALVYVNEKKNYMAIDEVPGDCCPLNISGTELRTKLEQDLEIPDWFSFPEIIEELKKAKPPLNQRGFTIFFTGLSGAGKSVLAKGLLFKLLEINQRPVTLLDGDIVRTHLSSELGFSKEHRSINVQRIGVVASEITKNGGIAICAPIAPYRLDRQYNRNLISQFGGYIEVHVNTPLEVCEERDVKGLYAKAREGIVKEFTGVSDPYESPENPEISIDSTEIIPPALIQKIISVIKTLGYI